MTKKYCVEKANEAIANSTEFPIMIQVLKAVQKYIDPLAFIAGGSLFDLEEGRTPRDVDLFFYAGDNKPYWNTINLLNLVLEKESIEFEIMEWESSENFNYESNYIILRVINVKISGLKFQFVQLGEYGVANERVKEFPLSTSQIYIDRDWVGVVRSDQYIYSKENKVIVNLSDGGEDKHEVYISKIRNKLKDYVYCGSTKDMLMKLIKEG